VWRAIRSPQLFSKLFYPLSDTLFLLWHCHIKIYICKKWNGIEIRRKPHLMLNIANSTLPEVKILVFYIFNYGHETFSSASDLRELNKWFSYTCVCIFMAYLVFYMHFRTEKLKINRSTEPKYYSIWPEKKKSAILVSNHKNIMSFL
jgi:hypothetical protein